MTLTHYVFHMTIGTIVLAKLTSKSYTGFPTTEQPIQPIYLILYAIKSQYASSISSPSDMQSYMRIYIERASRINIPVHHRQH